MYIIYSKFSNDRRDEYAIVTNILKDEEGNRYIEKLATKPAGQKHISNLSIWEKELKEKYTFTKENITDILREEVGHVFAQVLEHAGVYKRDAAGRAAFLRFVAAV